MDEKKKLFLTIIAALAVLFFLLTRFCLPVAKDNAERLAQYKQLKTEVEVLRKFGKDGLDSLGSRIDAAISNLERRIPAEGKLKLMEQLTRVPADANIAFTAITHKRSSEQDDYQAFPVDVSMKASFYDTIKYLAAIETGPLMIGVDSLSLRRLEPGAESLDIKVTFLGFGLAHKFPPMSRYLEERYRPFDKRQLEKLLEPTKPRGTEVAVLTLKDYNPFVYKFKKPAEGITHPELELGIESFSLRGIMRVGSEKVALINDTMVREGEKIGGIEVVEIQDYRVVLMRAGKRYILKMGVEIK